MMNSRDFKKELPLYMQTGRQDAANAMDPNEIRDALGDAPTAGAIKKWLLDELSVADMEGTLEFPEEASEAQKKELLSLWADGWASYAANYFQQEKRR